MSKAPKSPNYPEMPTGSTVYNDDGSLVGSVSTDAQGNLVYRSGGLNATDTVAKQAAAQGQSSWLNTLKKTPAEYTAAATQEAKSWTDLASRNAGEQFQKDVANVGEKANLRGLYGSKAYAQTVQDRTKQQAQQTSDIASQGTSMREGLINQKMNNSQNMLNAYSGISNNFANREAQNKSTVMGAYNTALGSYNSKVNALSSQYQNKVSEWQNNDPWRNYIMPTLTTGAYIGGSILSNPALFSGSGSTSGSKKASDRRLKKNIVPAFKVGDVQFYSFEYDVTKWPEGFLPPQEGKHIGVMSDEVRHIPGAVKEGVLNGFDIVDYEAVRNYLKMEKA